MGRTTAASTPNNLNVSILRKRSHHPQVDQRTRNEIVTIPASRGVCTHAEARTRAVRSCGGDVYADSKPRVTQALTADR